MISRPDSHYFPSYLLQCTFIYLQLNDVVTYFRCIQFVIVLFGKKNAVALHENKVQALGRYLGWKMLEKKIRPMQCGIFQGCNYFNFSFCGKKRKYLILVGCFRQRDIVVNLD